MGDKFKGAQSKQLLKEKFPAQSSRKASLGGGPEKKFIFVPAGAQINAKDLKQILGKKMLNIPCPEMLMQFDIGTRHPADLCTEKLLKRPAFNGVLEHLEQWSSG